MTENEIRCLRENLEAIADSSMLALCASIQALLIEANSEEQLNIAKNLDMQASLLHTEYRQAIAAVCAQIPKRLRI